MINKNVTLWVERYRPQTMEEVILPKRVKDKFQGDAIIQNYLFAGTQGTGKTTLAKVIAKKYSALLINASLENGIDEIRNQVDNFCGLRSLTSNSFKLVIFDEADQLTPNAQNALRGVIEKYASTARFIFTCNFPDKLSDPIKSRLEPISFDYTDEEVTEVTTLYLKRIIEICTQNSMTIDREAIIHIIKTNYPDMRSIINRLESLYHAGIRNITVKDVNKTTNVKNEEFFKFICSNPQPTTIYTMTSAFKGREHSMIADLSKNFIPFISGNDQYKPKIGDVALKIHKYSFESKSVIDPFVSLLSLCYELSLILK